MHRLSGPTGLLFFLAATLLVAFDANAQTRTERFRWTHATPSQVAGFKLHYGTTSGVHTQQLNVNLPPRDASNAYYVDLVVPEENPVYAVVTAYNALGQESAKSNQKFRPGSASVPPPPPTTASAALAGFALWNAQTDTAVDTAFVSGERIDLKTLPCTAIQIKTNAYLNTNNAPGSVKKIFDGQTLACSASSAPTSHENNPPYAWETDQAPGQFDCAATLKTVGSHTLTAIPYDGDNCTGLAGAASTLTFEVFNSAPPAPGPAPLGQPGQPVLIQ